jgi:transposase
MSGSDIFTLGLSPPWRVVDQRLETDRQPHELHLAIAAESGALFPCPKCSRPSKRHDWKEDIWRHLNFFEHACFIRARVPRVDCTEHGVLRIKVRWARPESGFTLPFEQAVLVLMREMPIVAAISGDQQSRGIEITRPPDASRRRPRSSRKGARVENRSRMGSTSITTTTYGLIKQL